MIRVQHGHAVTWLLSLTLVWSAGMTRFAQASLGPENVFVVVNPMSWSSQTIANHFLRIRRIPQSNVFWLAWNGSVIETDMATFASQILQPILREINRRNLAGQIDCIAYSSDFPYAIDFRSLSPNDKFAKGALTGLTMFYDDVLTGNAGFIGREPNHYASLGLGESDTRAYRTLGASGSYRTQHKQILSVMLGYTSGRANSTEEVVAYLARSGCADGIQPAGRIYYMQDANVRTRTRSPRFPLVTAALQRERISAEIIDASLPKNKQDVQGLMLGTQGFRFRNTNSRILPGAICDNFTSFGGVLDDYSRQTPLTELLRYGASGSSGTVVEPYALRQKFPDASIHLHYTRGLSLAEAFYRSVQSPYQLLIVGDPLCRPWGRCPQVQVQGLTGGETLEGVVELSPSSSIAAGIFGLFVDGQQIAECKPGESFRLNTRRLPDGQHEFRVVHRLPDLVASQGRLVLPVTVRNTPRRLQINVPRNVTFGKQLLVDVEAEGCERVLAFRARRPVAELMGSTGKLAIDTKQLGLGPIRLELIGVGAEKQRPQLVGRSATIQILASSPMPALRVASQPSQAGFRVSFGGTARVVESTERHDWLERLGYSPGQALELESFYQASETGTHHLQLYYQGSLQLNVDGTKVLVNKQPSLGRVDLPVSLASGWHRLQVRATLKSAQTFDIRLGYRGARRLGSRSANFVPL